MTIDHVAILSISKWINGLDLDKGAHKVQQIISNIYFIYILRSMINQLLKFDLIAMLGLLHISKGSGGNLLARNSMRKMEKKWTVLKECFNCLAKHEDVM